jgi:release factor glutamine methyltransferase
VAAANRAELGLAGRVKLLQADLLDGIDGEFDVILANLPYLRSDQRDPSTVREPESALYAGADGLEQYRRLWPQAAARLAAGGLIACELDPGQADEMERLAERHIGGEVATLVDLAGRERFVIAGAVDIVRTVVDTWPYGA